MKMHEFLIVKSFVREHIPGFEVRYKNESWVSKIIAILIWVFNREYMKSYTTTRYPCVYFPSKKFVNDNPRLATKILLHEFVHLWDRKNQGVMFTLRYLSLQWMAIPNILFATIWVFVVQYPEWARWTFAGLGWGVGVLCLLPWPSKGRAKAEIRGYSMNMAVNYWRYGVVRQKTKDWIIEKFTGWEYYRMWPWESDVNSWLTRACAQVRYELFGMESISGRSGRPYQLAKEMFDKNAI